MAIRIFSGVQPAMEALNQEIYPVKRAYYIGEGVPKIMVPFKHRMERVPEVFFEKLFKGKSVNHQGVAVEVDIPGAGLGDLNKEQNVLLLDEITDEQNLGNISRTAAFFNFQGIITASAKSAGVSPVVDRIASGGSLHLKYIEVSNLGNAIDHLRDMGFWIAGASEHADQKAKEVLKPAHHPWGIMIGNEEKGIGLKLLEKADFQVKIETPAAFKTLNAATAATILCTYCS